MKDFKFLEENMSNLERETLNLFRTYTLLQLKSYKEANYDNLSPREVLIINGAIKHHRDYISLKLSKNETKRIKS